MYSAFAYGHPVTLPEVGGFHDETLVLPKLVVFDQCEDEIRLDQ